MYRLEVEVDTSDTELPEVPIILATPDASPREVLLDLSDCSSLTKLPDYLFTGSIQLVEVNLTGCSSLKSLPPAIGHATQLRKLVLKGCTALKDLPPTLGDLKELKVLDLSGCKTLTTLPKSLAHAGNLHSLNCSECTGLTSLPQSLGRLARLKTLDLTGCSSLIALPETLAQNQYLEVAIKGCTSLVNIPPGLRWQVVGQLGENPKGAACLPCFAGLDPQRRQAVDRFSMLGMLVFVVVLFVTAYTPFQQQTCPAVATPAGRHLLQGAPSSPAPPADPPPPAAPTLDTGYMLLSAAFTMVIVGLGVGSIPDKEREELCGCFMCGEANTFGCLMCLWHMLMSVGGMLLGIIGMAIKISRSSNVGSVFLIVAVCVVGMLSLFMVIAFGRGAHKNYIDKLAQGARNPGNA
jgi:hypothetical protein